MINDDPLPPEIERILAMDDAELIAEALQEYGSWDKLEKSIDMTRNLIVDLIARNARH